MTTAERELLHRSVRAKSLDKSAVYKNALRHLYTTKSDVELTAPLPERNVKRRHKVSPDEWGASLAAARRVLDRTVEAKSPLEKDLFAPAWPEARRRRESASRRAATVGQVNAADRIELLQRWDGVVVDVGERVFRAKLLDERSGRPELETEIYMDEVPAHDQPLLRPGAVFYWHIGYRDPDGDRERVSRIKFRRLPPKTEGDLRRAEQRAADLRKRFGWSSPAVAQSSD